MAGDGSDAFENEAEPTVTIGEYIEGIEAEELEADLVLGGDDGKECTYGGGYLKRQAVFSCLTCVAAGATGVCTACSLACHDGHELECWISVYWGEQGSRATKWVFFSHRFRSIQSGGIFSCGLRIVTLTLK